MFRDDYLRLRRFEVKLANKWLERQRKMNQPVTIRDIFVYPQLSEGSFGEAVFTRNVYKENQPAIVRLIDHIEMLASIANEYHRQYYCKKDRDGVDSLDERYGNCITRILLTEFSLYSAQPFSMQDYSLLLDAISAIGKNQLPNVHLLLSSIAVLANDNQILNVTLYVQCGTEPKIEAFCKSSPSKADITYRATANFGQQSIETGVLSTIEYVAPQAGSAISSNSVFTVETAGGAVYNQAVDVCLDHALMHSMRLMKRVITSDITNHSFIIPSQIDHLVTSNSISIHPHAVLARAAVHVDTLNSTPEPLSGDIVRLVSLQDIIMNKYAHTSIQNDFGGYLIKKPPFGASCTIIPTAERLLSGFTPDLEPLVQRRNHALMEYAISRRMVQADQSAKVMYAIDASIVQLKHFYRLLYDKCESSLLDALFNTITNKINIEAKTCISKSYRELRRVNQDIENFTLNANRLLDDLKVQLQNLNHKLPHQVKDELIKDVDAMLANLRINKLRPV